MSPTVLDFLRQIEEAVSQHDEEGILEIVAALVDAEPANAALFLWTRFHLEENRYFRRVLSYAIAKTAGGQSKYLWGPLATYVAGQHGDDEATLVNTIAALNLYDERDDILSAVFAPVFGTFSLSCLGSAGYVVNAFCDLVVDLSDRGLLVQLLSSSQVQAAIQRLADSLPSEGHIERDAALAVLRENKCEDVLPDLSFRLDEEDESLNREPPTELDGAASLLHAILANARSSYALRKQAGEVNGVIQEIKLTGAETTKGRLAIEVFDKLVDSWRRAIREVVHSRAGADSTMTTYLLAPAQGSFIVRFLIASDREEVVAEALDYVAGLVEKPERMSFESLSVEARSNIVDFAETLGVNQLDATVGTLDLRHFERSRTRIVGSTIQPAVRAIRDSKQEENILHNFVGNLEGANRRQGTFEAHSKDLGYVRGEVPVKLRSTLVGKEIGRPYNFSVEERLTILGTGEKKPLWILKSIIGVAEEQILEEEGVPEEPKKLLSVDVPQQDRFDRIVDVVKLVSSGKELRPKALKMKDTDSSLRHIDYMRHAAKILGLLAEDGRLTEAGRKLAQLPKSRVLDLLSIQFELSTVGRLWKTWAGGVEDLHQLDEDSAEKFLLDQGLSPSMAKRRGRTLRKWLHRFKTGTME